MLAEHQGHVLTTFVIAITLLIGLLIMGHFLGKSIQKAEASKPIRGNRKERRLSVVSGIYGFAEVHAKSLEIGKFGQSAYQSLPKLSPVLAVCLSQ